LIFIKKGQLKDGREERPQWDIKVPWSLWHGHPLISPSHNFLQKVRGQVVRLIEKCGKQLTKRYSEITLIVKKKIFSYKLSG